MVITSEHFDAALGDFLAKTTDDSIKNVLGIFDKEKTVPQNIAKLKDGSSGAALQDTITFLKTTSPEYPVAQHVLSCKNRNKEEYSRDIAKFLDFVKPTQCLACRENYIPAAEQCTGNDTKCYLCQRPSHGECYKETVIKPELGVIFVCTECLSVKAAKDLAADLNNRKPDDAETDTTRQEIDSNAAQDSKAPVPDEAKPNQDKEDCPLYLKRLCPHGLTGKKEINGNPCPYKHRIRCKYYIQFGPDGCRFGKKCTFLHPPMCQNSLQLKTCLNRDCPEHHFKGTERKTKKLPKKPQPTITTSNRFPSWMAENTQADAYLDPQNNPRSDRLNPWMKSSQTTMDKQSPPKTDPNNSRDFLERHLAEMKADLMSFIRTSITQAVPSPQHQYMMMQPANVNQQSNTKPVPIENWTNSAINVQTTPQLECTQTNVHQVSNYPQLFPPLQQPQQITTLNQPQQITTR